MNMYSYFLYLKYLHKFDVSLLEIQMKFMVILYPDCEWRYE